MNQQGVSNAELARRLGKSRAYVTKLLRGTTNFTLESLVRIGRALSCEVEFELLPKPAQTKASAASKVIRKTSSKTPTKGIRKGGKNTHPSQVYSDESASHEVRGRGSEIRGQTD